MARPGEATRNARRNFTAAGETPNAPCFLQEVQEQAKSVAILGETPTLPGRPDKIVFLLTTGDCFLPTFLLPEFSENI